MKQLSILLILLTLAAILGPNIVGGQHRPPPAPAVARPFTLPSARDFTLSNDLAIALVEDHRTPLVTINVAIPAGTTSESPEQPGLADATAELITEGSRSKTADQIAQAVEAAGAEISAAADDDFTIATASVVSENIEGLIELLGEILLTPSFPENEVDLYRVNRIERLKVDRQDPEFLAEEQFGRAVYGDHPYGRLAPTPESIRSITRNKLREFHQSRYIPRGSVLVAVGDFEMSRLETRLRSVFSNWKNSTGKLDVAPKIGEQAKRAVCLVDRPNSEQTTIRVGGLGIARPDPDYFPLLVATTILGGGASSRLFNDLRELKGYAYDASAFLEVPLQRGVFYGATETRTAATIAAITDMLGHFKRIAGQRVTAIELRKAKNYLNGTFSLGLSTQSGTAQRLVLTRAMGLGSDYLDKYRARIESVSAADVARVSRKYLSNPSVIVVVGDGRRLRSQLARFGKLTVIKS